METYLIYIAKVAVAAGAFYIAFLLLFQNQKHFVFNRIYLPVSLAVSFVIPLVTFTTIKYIEPTNFDTNSFAYLAESTEVLQPEFIWEWYHYLFGLYIIGVVGFLFHLLIGHLKAIKIIQKSRVQKIFESIVNITKKDVHPFSFFNKIVISEKTLTHPDLEMIVSHENIHVQEKHTLDILFAEILFLFQWFNPFAWLIKDAVKNNLEYLTDNEIAKHYNPQTYQLAMVTLADKQGIAPFLTALNGSQLKNRIIMMKKKTENKYAFVKQLVVLPLLAVLVMGLSNREVKTEIIPTAKKDTVRIIGIAKIEEETKVSGTVKAENGKPLAGVGVLVKGTNYGTITDSNGNFKLLIDNKAETLIFTLEGFEKLEIAAGHGESQVIETELKVTRQSKPGEIKVEGYANTKTQEPQSSHWKLSGPFNGVVEKESEKITFTPTTQKGLRFTTMGDKTKQPLYVVDGLETEDVNQIAPDDIESISVLKEKSSTDLYGEKGKNGVILITTKNATQNNSEEKNDTINVSKTNSKVSIRNIKTKGNPVVIVDGQRYDSVDDANVQPDEIASMSVLKNDSASTKIYGEQAKNGVIVINTKTKYNSEKAEPLIIVNEKETEKVRKDLDDIDPETIQSMNVLKDEKATVKYGEKGKNGVIEITLKEVK